MAFVNESDWNRGVRFLAGTLMLIAGWGFAGGVLSTLLVVAGFTVAATGISGWCPVYTALGVSTRKGRAEPCPNCGVTHRL